MRLKILYIIPPSESFAGVERVVDDIANQLAIAYKDDFEIDVFHASSYKNHQLRSTKYNIIQGDLKNLRSLFLSYRSLLKKKKYDTVVICQVEPLVICWLAKWFKRPKMVLYIHGNPSVEKTSLKSSILFILLRLLVLRSLAGVFGVSPLQTVSFKKTYPSNVPHYYVPNPTRKLDTSLSDATKKSDFITFVNVGRYCRQKGQDILLDAFIECYKSRQDIRLRLVGFGEEKASLLDRVRKEKLEEIVYLDERPTNPEEILAVADVYVSTSRWEGWPLVLCEALQFGLPVIAVDCDFGPREIISSPAFGTIVPYGRIDLLVDVMLEYCDGLPDTKLAAAERISYAKTFFVEEVAKIHRAALRASSEEV